MSAFRSANWHVGLEAQHRQREAGLVEVLDGPGADDVFLVLCRDLLIFGGEDEDPVAVAASESARFSIAMGTPPTNRVIVVGEERDSHLPAQPSRASQTFEDSGR